MARTSSDDTMISQDLKQRLHLSEQAKEVVQQQLVRSMQELGTAQLRVVELEGTPAALEHASRARELEALRGNLAVLEGSHLFEQEVLRDRVAERKRATESLGFKVQELERTRDTTEAAAAAARAERDASLLSLAEERKLRHLSEHELQTKLAPGLPVSQQTLREQREAREQEAARLMAALQGAEAERDALAERLGSAKTTLGARDATIGEAVAVLRGVQNALGLQMMLKRKAKNVSAEVEAEETAAAAVAAEVRGAAWRRAEGGHFERYDPMAEEAADEDDVESFVNLLPAIADAIADALRELQEKATQAEGLKAETERALQAEQGIMISMDAAETRMEAMIQEMGTLRRNLQTAEQAIDLAERERSFPTDGFSADLEEQKTTISELRSHASSLELRSGGLQDELDRTEQRFRGEQRARAEATAEVNKMSEDLETLTETLELAELRAIQAEEERSVLQANLAEEAEAHLALREQVELGKQKESAYAYRAAAVQEAVSTSDMKTLLLEERMVLLGHSLKAEEDKVQVRDQMLRSVQREMSATRKRCSELEQQALVERHLTARAEAGRAEASAEAAELGEKLTLAMMEVNSRASRLEYSHAQVTTARAEMRSLDNQLVIFSNQLASTQQANAQLAESEGSKSAQLSSLQEAAAAKEERLTSMENTLTNSRAERSELVAEVARLREKLDSAADETELLDQQLLHSQNKFELAQADLSTRAASERRARRDARDEQLLRQAHESRLLPLHETLREREDSLQEAGARQSGSVLLAERLKTAEAQRVADAEAVQAAALRAIAAEKKSANALERNEQLKAELTRRESRSAALRKSLAAAEEELALLRSSKDLLAARFELHHEIKRQRELVATEDAAVQRAVEEARGRQLGALDGLVHAAGKHAVQAVAAARQAAAQASVYEGRVDAKWRTEMVQLESTQELSEGLEAAKNELHEQQERASELDRKLRSEREANEARKEREARVMVQSFNNTALLVKLLIHTKQLPENLLTQDLYEEVITKEIPVDEWPTYVHARMSGGQPISSWY